MSAYYWELEVRDEPRPFFDLGDQNIVQVLTLCSKRCFDYKLWNKDTGFGITETQCDPKVGEWELPVVDEYSEEITGLLYLYWVRMKHTGGVPDKRCSHCQKHF